MNKLDIIKTTLSNKTGRFGLKVQKHSPEILMGIGVVGVVGTAVLASKATLQLDGILDDTSELLNKVSDVESRLELGEELTLTDGRAYTKKDVDKDRALVYFQAGVKITKLYLPAVSLGVVSIACLLGSHNIMKKRNVALMAAYRVLDEGFTSYRKRVIDEFGEEKDYNYRHGIISVEEKTFEEIDENGKKKKVKKKVAERDPNATSIYARFFDDGCREWSKNPEYNMVFLKTQQNFANDLLKARGHLFLNEVYDSLGIPRSEAGAIVGWILDEDSDNFVDFGLYSGRSSDFINGYERSILLDFNVDGIIFDRI